MNVREFADSRSASIITANVFIAMTPVDRRFLDKSMYMEIAAEYVYSAEMQKAEDEYPMRINRYLAREGVATRRGADELVARGKVLINGRVATLGEKINKGDKVELRGKTSQNKFLYYAYNKPVGVITHSPQF
ncbi:MAG: S4 domain-containing protein, partial [Patescibacteria group bacterium]